MIQLFRLPRRYARAEGDSRAGPKSPRKLESCSRIALGWIARSLAAMFAGCRRLRRIWRNGKALFRHLLLQIGGADLANPPPSLAAPFSELLTHRASNPPPSSSLAEETPPPLAPPPCGGARFPTLAAQVQQGSRLVLAIASCAASAALDLDTTRGCLRRGLRHPDLQDTVLIGG
jgi:hypothetical protein